MEDSYPHLGSIVSTPHLSDIPFKFIKHCKLINMVYNIHFCANMGYLFPFFNFSSQLKTRFYDKLIRDPNTFYGCYYVTANNILEKEFHALRLISCLIFHFLFSMNNLKR